MATHHISTMTEMRDVFHLLNRRTECSFYDNEEGEGKGRGKGKGGGEQEQQQEEEEEEEEI